jgi:hypothetical protein
MRIATTHPAPRCIDPSTDLALITAVVARARLVPVEVARGNEPTPAVLGRLASDLVDALFPMCARPTSRAAHSAS